MVVLSTIIMEVYIKSISGCTFTGNTAAYGGAIYNSGTINSVSGCTFTGNKASYGGAICNFFASLNLAEWSCSS